LNVGSGVGTTLYDLAARVQALSDAAVGLRVLPARAVEVTRFVADVSRMCALLGLEPPSDPLVTLDDLWDAVRRA
jgi:UDP-glucose 4-epimerase